MPFVSYPKRQLVNKKWYDPNCTENSFYHDARCRPGVVIFLNDSEEGEVLDGGMTSDFDMIGPSTVARELVDLRDVVTSLTARRAARDREVSDDQIRMLREDARVTGDLDTSRACSAALGLPTGDGALGMLCAEECRERVAEVIHRDRHYWSDK